MTDSQSTYPEPTSDKLRLSLAWADIEQTAQKQIINCLDEEHVIELYVMPDVHAGMDIPIGSVVVSKCVVPAYVGVDIGCSVSMLMLYHDFDLDAHLIERHGPSWKEDLEEKVIAKIPVGPGRNNTSWKDKELFKELMDGEAIYNPPGNLPFIDDLKERVNAKALNAVGSLGGGNHFIEIGKSESGQWSISIHSGSRGPGHMIATAYIDYLKETGVNYIDEHNVELLDSYRYSCKWAQNFATCNHVRMHHILWSVLELEPDETKEELIEKQLYTQHNCINGYTSYTTWADPVDYYVHRKGATALTLDAYADLLPTNMADGILLVRPGYATTDWHHSCSHGAGRALSRTKAKKTITPAQWANVMGDTVYNENRCVDEAPQAYKPLSEVIPVLEEKGIAKVINTFRPVVVIKG